MTKARLLKHDFPGSRLCFLSRRTSRATLKGPSHSGTLLSSQQPAKNTGCQTTLRLEKNTVKIVNLRAEGGEKLKYPLFGGSPLFYEAPPRQSQPPQRKFTPSKIQIGEGRFLCIFNTKTQRAAKGGTQKGVGHFFLFRSPFGNHFCPFFLTFLVSFLPIPFCLPLLRQGEKLHTGGRQSLFGGHQFTFWGVPIYIFEAGIVLGAFFLKGVDFSFSRQGAIFSLSLSEIPSVPKLLPIQF